ncbi:unnamed protein product [Eretmochelys imbricata]
MQWFHAQRLRVLQEGGTVVLLFSRGAVARCMEWLLWKQGEQLPQDDPYSAFSASLKLRPSRFPGCKAGGRYLVACFEDLLRPADIPELFRTVPIFTLPSQLPTFPPGAGWHCCRQGAEEQPEEALLWIGEQLAARHPRVPAAEA